MIRTGFFIAAAALLLSPAARAQSNEDRAEPFYAVVRTVEDIIAGKNLEQAKNAIVPGALLVRGTDLVNLREVVEGRNPKVSLVDTAQHAVMIMLKTNKAEDAGHLILKTVAYGSEKLWYHTVTFMKDSTGQVMIESWHAGE